ncbi:retrovirus-related Pol polyprotein from type-1 retrotransposable element R2 [Caerostris darwini]|uniref:Retrovirus-related Pol polyprotein from type-1 retrotransposable element R2 n=1 Tax=Caerostris darwini TaxID=1538125 RepID=A0AAV4TE31_9ARAC|nr:retrovirus-related Pol polyprotein from type-1 retrotransposable element R2 [Caerostris darwini]
MSRAFLNKHRKLCVSDCIRWSRDIYIEFLTGHCQYTADNGGVAPSSELSDGDSFDDSNPISPNVSLTSVHLQLANREATNVVDEDNTGADHQIYGTSEAIPIRSVVKQGCPLSGLFFNIAIDPIIRSLQGASDQHKVLAFADDLCLISNHPADFQDLLDHQMNRLGLHLNPNKSFAFHMRGSTPVGTCDTSFLINNHRLHPVHEGEFHKFLGKPVELNAVPNYSSLNDLAELGFKLATSKLTPWQRLDALLLLIPAVPYANCPVS